MKQRNQWQVQYQILRQAHWIRLTQKHICREVSFLCKYHSPLQIWKHICTEINDTCRTMLRCGLHSDMDVSLFSPSHFKSAQLVLFKTIYNLFVRHLLERIFRKDEVLVFHWLSSVAAFIGWENEKSFVGWENEKSMQQIKQGMPCQKLTKQDMPSQKLRFHEGIGCHSTTTTYHLIWHQSNCSPIFQLFT